MLVSPTEGRSNQIISCRASQTLSNATAMKNIKSKSLTNKLEKAKKGSPTAYIRSIQNANMQLLQREIMKGLNPKWYAVIHFNDAANSKRQQKRRLDIDAVEEDCEEVKDQLYTELYGRNWRKKTKRAKSIWGIEYGSSQIKPHINLIIEDLPYPYDTYKSAYVLLDRYLPLKCKCLWKRSAHLQPVDIDSFSNLNSYCCKESDFRNTTIIHSITDYQL